MGSTSIIPPKAAPFSRTAPFTFHKSATEMALIDKSASECNFSKLEACFVQEPLCVFDAPHQKPRMRRRSGGLLKRFGEIVARQATYTRDFRNRGITIQVCFDKLTGSTKLPGRKAVAPRNLPD